MKTFLKILKWIGISIGILMIVFVIAVYAMQGKKYDAPLPDIHASHDSAVIARGEYLAFGPAHCSACHVPSEDSIAVNVNGEHLPFRGGYGFVLPIGTIRSANITPDETGIGKMTDPEIARALRFGVGHDGRAIFDFMPFHNLSDEDLTAVISYLRSQKPVQNEVKIRELNFIGKTVNAFLIKPIGPDGNIPKLVHADTTAEYGAYLARNITNCRGCHSERNLYTGAYTGPDYAGGMKFEHPDAGFDLVTPNLTPDESTSRLTGWTQEMFMNRFRQGRLIKESEMPWEQFKQISDNDLKAIYKFLRSLNAIKHDNGPTVQPIKKS